MNKISKKSVVVVDNKDDEISTATLTFCLISSCVMIIGLMYWAYLEYYHTG